MRTKRSAEMYSPQNEDDADDDAGECTTQLSFSTEVVRTSYDWPLAKTRIPEVFAFTGLQSKLDSFNLI